MRKCPSLSSRKPDLTSTKFTSIYERETVPVRLVVLEVLMTSLSPSLSAITSAAKVALCSLEISEFIRFSGMGVMSMTRSAPKTESETKARNKKMFFMSNFPDFYI